MGLTVVEELLNTRTGQATAGCYGSFANEPPRWTKEKHTERKTEEKKDPETGFTTTTYTDVVSIKYYVVGNAKFYAPSYRWTSGKQPVYTMSIRKEVEEEDITGDVFDKAYTELKNKLTEMGKTYIDPTD
jgi:hypothetical protein